MKREDLKKIEGLTDEMIDKIMQLHGQSVESQKSKLTTAETELSSLKKQLEEANQQIESFKGMNIDQIKAAAEEWKAKAEQAQNDAQAQIQQLKFEHALDQALTGAKARNPKAVRALLQMDALKLNEADGSIVGLKEQLEKLQSEADYLFESDQPAPKIVAGGGNPNPSSISTFEAAARRGAGLPVQGK